MSGLRPRPTGIRFSTFDFLFSNRDKVNMGFVVRDLSPVIASVQISGYYQWQQRRDQVIVRALPALFQVTDRQINPTTGGFDGQVILTPFRNHIITAGISFYRDTSADDRIVIRGTLPTPPGGLTPAQAQTLARASVPTAMCCVRCATASPGGMFRTPTFRTWPFSCRTNTPPAVMCG